MNTLARSQDHEPLEEGARVGRYVVLRDSSGTLHAVSPVSVSALCEADDGTVLLLPVGRVIVLRQSLQTVLAWLELRG